MPWYRDVVMEGLAAGVRRPRDRARARRRLPDGIRGYEDIKLRSIAKVRGQALTLTFKDSTTRST